MSVTELSVRYCTSPDTAPKYTKEEGFYPAQLDEIVVVAKGTVNGRSTLDLIFHDEQGKKHVAMVTARLLNTALQNTVNE